MEKILQHFKAFKLKMEEKVLIPVSQNWDFRSWLVDVCILMKQNLTDMRYFFTSRWRPCVVYRLCEDFPLSSVPTAIFTVFDILPNDYFTGVKGGEYVGFKSSI